MPAGVVYGRRFEETVMRTDNDQFDEILKRSDALKIRKKSMNVITLCSIGMAAVAALVVILFGVVGFEPVAVVEEETTFTQYGSITVTSPYVGYIVIAVCAFILGALATVLISYVKKLKELESPE